MANLLDLMTEKDRKVALDAYEKRMHGDNTYRKAKVSPIAYLLAELGIYFGWEAIAAAKRGYIETFDEHTGKRKKLPLSMEELGTLAEAARKVRYSEYLNQARCTQIAAGSVLSKSPEATFKKGMKPYIEEAKL